MPRKISQLEAATDVTASDLIQVVDIEDTGMAVSGTNKRATAQLMANELGKLTNITAAGSTAARLLANRFADVVNVKDFGAVGNGVADDYASFVLAIAALPAGGGKIIVPSGVYNISAAPTWGAKSIYWDIDVNAVFTGTGTGYGLFPNIATNIGNIAAGPWVQSRTTQAPPYVGAAVNAATFEMIAPTSATNGYYVALYAGGAGNAPSPTNDVWASNFVIEANTGSLGAYFGLEVDVISQSLSAMTRGILISGHGNFDADVALEIDRNLVIGTGEWYYGITTKAAKNAIQIFADASLEKGISIGTAYTSDFQRSLFSGKQLDNVVGNAAVVLQRNTDTLPVGDLIRCVNSANTDIIFNVDAIGNVGCDGFFISQNDIKTHSGAMIIADSTGAITYFDARSTGILAPNLPTSSIGLPAGSLWVDTTAGNVVKRV